MHPPHTPFLPKYPRTSQSRVILQKKGWKRGRFSRFFLTFWFFTLLSRPSSPPHSNNFGKTAMRAASCWQKSHFDIFLTTFFLEFTKIPYPFRKFPAFQGFNCYFFGFFWRENIPFWRKKVFFGKNPSFTRVQVYNYSWIMRVAYFGFSEGLVCWGILVMINCVFRGKNNEKSRYPHPPFWPE